MLAFRLILSVSIFFIISACADTPRVANAHYFRHFNFSAVKSYAFYGRNDDSFDYQNLSDVTRNSIELAIENQLDKQGLVYKDLKQADIIVSYFWVKDPDSVSLHSRNIKANAMTRHYQIKQQQRALSTRMELKKYNQGVRYCAACLKVSSVGPKVSEINTKAGALIMDFISPKTQRSVWRSSYPVIIKEKDNSREIQQRIQRAVQQMLLQFPKS
jgi:hypothetical protein